MSAHLGEHIERRLISDSMLLGIGHGLAPSLGKLDGCGLGAKVDKPGVEVAVQQR